MIRFGEERSEGFPGLMEGHDDVNKGSDPGVQETLYRRGMLGSRNNMAWSLCK